MASADIVQWAESANGFYVDRFWDAQGHRWQTKRGPIRLAPYHARILRHIFTPDAAGRLPYDVIGWCEPAKSGKSAIAGLCAEYVGLHLESNTSILLASNKQAQAESVMFASVAQSVRMNPNIRSKPDKFSIRFKNGNTIEAIPSSSRGQAGARYSLACFDELWGYQYQDAERLWSEFKTDPTRLVSMRLAIGYAGYLESKLWLDLLQKGMAGQPVAELADIVNPDGSPACWENSGQFTFWSHVCRQPWQTDEWRERQRQSLSASEYARMIETTFVEGLGNFIDPESWAALIDPQLKPLEPTKHRAVWIGLDLAMSAGGDDCALIGVYEHPSGKIAVAFHKVWAGRFRLRRLKLAETVKPYLLRAAELYNVAGVFFDPWQAQFLADELRQAGINCVDVPQTRQTRGAKDTMLQQLAQDKRIALYDDPELRAMASGATALELGDGRIFLKKASGRSQIDLLVALSNVCDQAAQRGPAVSIMEYGGVGEDEHWRWGPVEISREWVRSHPIRRK